LGLHPDRTSDDEAGLGPGLRKDLLRSNGRREVSRREVEVLLERSNQLGKIDAVRVRDLLEEVVAADEILRALEAELGDDSLHLRAHLAEEARAAFCRGVDALRGELLQAVLLGLLDGLDLCRDPDVAGVEL